MYTCKLHMFIRDIITHSYHRASRYTLLYSSNFFYLCLCHRSMFIRQHNIYDHGRSVRPFHSLIKKASCNLISLDLLYYLWYLDSKLGSKTHPINHNFKWSVVYEIYVYQYVYFEHANLYINFVLRLWHILWANNL